MRLTWTGMGTTILGLFGTSLDPEAEVRPDLACTSPALTRFHLALRFWNQIFTCTSDSRREWAICERSVSDRYFLLWNSFSNSSSCSLVKAVRRRLALPPAPSPFPCPPFSPAPPLPQSSGLEVDLRKQSEAGLLLLAEKLDWTGLSSSPPLQLPLSGVPVLSRRALWLWLSGWPAASGTNVIYKTEA